MSSSSPHPAVTKLLQRPEIAQRTEPWYAARRKLITASDAAAALGILPFASYKGDIREDCLVKKLDNHPFSNIFCRHGQRYEDEARDLFCELTGEVAIDRGLVISEDDPWIGASPDGITMSGKLIEIKCPLRRKIIPGHIPHHYYPQVQVQMVVCGFDTTIFLQYIPAIMTIDKKPFMDVVVIERDPVWWEENKPRLRSFWEEYQRRLETHVPAPLPPNPKCLIDDTLYCS